MNKNIQKAKEAIETQNKLMLVRGPLNAKQLLHILQKTPKNHIYSRPAKGGGEWEYVTGAYVKKVLNYVFGWMWDFQIVDKGKEGDQIWVQGRLTIRNKAGQAMIVKEQFGRADIKFRKETKVALDYGNDMKAASTDSLKKCASELGIASDVYSRTEFKEIKQEATKIGGTKVNEMFAGVKEKEMIVKIALEMGAKEGLDEFIEKKTGLHIDMENLTKVQASKIIGELLRIQTEKK